MNKVHFGIDRLLAEPALQAELKGKRLGLVANPASVTEHLIHSLDALMAHSAFNITCAFGPQHGMRGEKQYNMIESEDYEDPIHHIPVFSLYGKTRKPSAAMLDHCDSVLFDLQDVGCRIFTYLTTLFYMMQACAQEQKSLYVLDRPNPAGRTLEGTILKSGNESFVGCAPILMRHGLTLGEIAFWLKDRYQIPVDLHMIEMKNYSLSTAPGYGWPLYERAWVNPSPNMPQLSCARVYSGTVMLEGTQLSEGRGTTRPLEGFGAPDIDGISLLKTMQHLAAREKHIDWLSGCVLRPFYFEPTFYKHQSKLCSGIQIHVDEHTYSPTQCKPYRLMALAFKAIRKQYPDYALWRDFPYEYVSDRLAIDVITGCDTLRLWVDDTHATLSDLEKILRTDELAWHEQTASYWRYV